MKIAALLLTAVVVLNSVDESLQSSLFVKCLSCKATSPPSPLPSPPPRSSEPSPPRPRFPYLPQGSLIIRDFQFPRKVYYKVGENNFLELPLHNEAVLNYERKVVAVFLLTSENVLFGLYYDKGGARVKITPACIYEGKKHIDVLDKAGYHYYPEFQHFAKPDGITLESLGAYRILGRSLACAHTTQSRGWYSDLPPQAHIVRGVEFPQGFFFKIDPDGLFHPLALHDCDVVVDSSGMIVAVFLGPSEYRLLGIYRGEGGERVKLTHVSMEASYIKLNPAEAKLYTEFMVYKKPSEMYRDSFAECG